MDKIKSIFLKLCSFLIVFSVKTCWIKMTSFLYTSIKKLSTNILLITFSLLYIKNRPVDINTFRPENEVKMNTISKNWGLFYPFFHFSTNSRKGVDWTEKEIFGHFENGLLKPKNNNARFLLKSFQPIHSLINSSSMKFKIKRLKI